MSSTLLTEENTCGCLEQVGDAADGCICLTSSVVQIVGRRYSLLVLSLLADRGSVRFSELRSELGEISSSTLSLRLAELEEAGLIERRTFAEIPPRVEYSLTDEGEALRRGLLSLARSASRRRSKTDS
jgi:DNA-binding HxlR family transcriptional regulator